MAQTLKTFELTQQDPAHCKSASFAAAGPRADHTGLFSDVRSGGSSSAPAPKKGFYPVGSAQQLADRKYQTSVLKNY